MNHIANFDKPLAQMSSQQIADLVNSRHDSVKRTIERLCTSGVIQLPPLVEVKNHLGQLVNNYIFEGEKGKRDSIVVVAQLSPHFTARLVDRWQELEAQLAPRIPSNFAEALQLAADQAKQLEQAQPKVEFVERYVVGTGLKSFRQVAKLLNANEADFRLFLVNKKIMYRLNNEWTVYQAHIEAGRFEVKTGAAISGHSYIQAKFTAKGVNWIAGLWGQHLAGLAA